MAIKCRQLSKNFICFFMLLSAAHVFAANKEREENLGKALRYGQYTIIDAMPHYDKELGFPDNCDGFLLSTHVIRRFYEIAKPVSQREFHDSDEVIAAPCAMKGHLKHQNQVYEFELMESGLSRVWNENVGIILFCKDPCESLLLRNS